MPLKEEGRGHLHNQGSILKSDLPGDGSINIRNDDFIIPVPQVDGAFTATGALVLCGHTENHVVGSILQL
jgi:hypothetical protein